MENLIGKPCIIKIKKNKTYFNKNGQSGIIVDYYKNANTYGILTTPKNKPLKQLHEPIAKYIYAFNRDEFEIIKN